MAFRFFIPAHPILAAAVAALQACPLSIAFVRMLISSLLPPPFPLLRCCQCWETAVGEDMYQLLILNLLATCFTTLL